MSAIKVAFYTIALNEEQFVSSWYESCKEGDYLLIADTGSSDNTVARAKELGINVINVNVAPWRFDIARNASLAALPKDIDYCVALDMDEVICAGWRAGLEAAKERGATRPRYKYTWSWTDANTPGLQYGGDKIHARTGYRWKHPVHEVLVPYGSVQEKHEWCDFEIHHHADNTKSRSGYMPLLEIAVQEDPHCDRNAFYYARELYYYGRYEDAVQQFLRHLLLPTATWGAERSASYRFIAKCKPEEAEYWILQAIKESPTSREPYVDLAKHYYSKLNWRKMLDAAEKALAITQRPLEYLTEADSWDHTPYDLAAISAYNLKEYTKAKEYGTAAVAITPTDSRLLSNLSFYTSSLFS